MPFFQTGFFDSTKFGYPYLDSDVVSFLKGPVASLPDGKKNNLVPFVFEKIESVEGEKCIVVSDFSTAMYFAVEKDFSLVQSEVYSQIMTTIANGGGVLSGRKISARTKFSKMKDYGNGICLPSNIELERFNDNPVQYEKVVILSVKINEGIKDNYFTDIIPDDAIVADAENVMVYKQGDRSSIEGLLKDAAKSKRVMIFRYISVTLGLIMIAIWFVLKYRKYLKKRTET